jgi:hypothetical protein
MVVYRYRGLHLHVEYAQPYHTMSNGLEWLETTYRLDHILTRKGLQKLPQQMLTQTLPKMHRITSQHPCPESGAESGAESAPGKNVNMYELGLFLRPLGKELQPKYLFDCLLKGPFT